MIAIIKYLKEKGQGIVEYALLLAFIVGIAMMLQGGGLGNAVKGVFDDTAVLLANFTDSRTPEEKDRANMEMLAKAFADNFVGKNNIGNKKQGRIDPETKKLMMPDNYMGIVVFSDGSVEVFAPNHWGQTMWISDWNGKSDALTTHYNDYMTTLQGATGIDFTDTAALSKQFAVSDAYPNGYAVVYDPGMNQTRIMTLQNKDSSSTNAPTRDTLNTDLLKYNQYHTDLTIETIPLSE